MFSYRLLSRIIRTVVNYGPFITATFAVEFMFCFVIGAIVFFNQEKEPLWTYWFIVTEGLKWCSTLACGVWLFIISATVLDNREKINQAVQIWAEAKDRQAQQRLAPPKPDVFQQQAEREVAALTPEINSKLEV